MIYVSSEALARIAKLYVLYIESGDKEFKNVPDILKLTVKELLEQKGLGHLAENYD